MRSTALGRHLMRFVPSSSLSSLQSAASTSAPSASALSSSSSIVPLRSSSTSTFLLRAAASCRSSPRISSTWTPRAMSTGGLGSGKTSIAAAATAAAGATEATAAMATDAANAAAALKNPAHSSPSSSKRRAALDAVLAPLEAVVGPLSREPMVPPHAPLVLVVSGPSGVGKDAAIRALHAARPGIRFVVTATSRERRPGEIDGVDYTFVSKQRFEEMISNDELLEHAVVYGEYKGIPKRAVEAALEAAREDVEERDRLLKRRAEEAAEAEVAEKDEEGGSPPSAPSAAAAVPAPSDPSSPPPPPGAGAGVVVLRLDVQGAATVRSLLPPSSCVSVFLVAESEAALAARLSARGTETPQALATRVATARSEAARASEFDFVVVNAEDDVDGTVEALGAIVDAERCRSSRRVF